MNKALQVDIFVEDRAQEAILKAFVSRLALEEGRAVSIRSRSARGGYARAYMELEVYQKLVTAQVQGVSIPDILVVARDANCRGFTEVRAEVDKHIWDSFKHAAVLACPDPHIERWYMADPVSFAKVVGSEPNAIRRKCDRVEIKETLQAAISEGGNPPTLGGIEFAPELVDAMDLYRASKNDKALKEFLDAARAKLKQM